MCLPLVLSYPAIGQLARPIDSDPLASAIVLSWQNLAVVCDPTGPLGGSPHTCVILRGESL